jgi:hypothetical protein
MPSHYENIISNPPSEVGDKDKILEQQERLMKQARDYDRQNIEWIKNIISDISKKRDKAAEEAMTIGAKKVPSPEESAYAVKCLYDVFIYQSVLDSLNH